MASLSSASVAASNSTRSLRSSSTSSPSGRHCWVDVDTTFLPSRKRPRKVSADNKDKHGGGTVTKSLDFAVKITQGQKNACIKRDYNRDLVGLDQVTIESVVISADEREDWRPISSLMQATVLDIVAHSTSMVKENLASAKDKKKLDEIYVIMKNELARESAPPRLVESRQPLDLVDDIDASSPSVLPAGNLLRKQERQAYHGQRGVQKKTSENTELSNNSFVMDRSGQEWSADDKEGFIRYLLHLFHQERMSL